MAARVSAGLTAAQGRRFGLTVGGAFAVLAAITWWRGHPLTMYVFGSLGSVLILAGLIVPTYLGPIERAWMALAHAISKVTTPIVMSVLYFLVLTPVGLIRRAAAGNSLVHEAAGSGFWRQRQAGSRRSSMERQF
jgi:hypothetical protein